MGSRLKRNLMLATALAAVLAGVLIAVLVPGSSQSPRRARSERPAVASAGTSEIALAARYLGLSPTALRLKLRSGHTLAELADSTPGKSAGGLVGALVRSRASRIKAQGLSSTQERVAVAGLRKRVQGVVQRRRAASTTALAADYLGLSISSLRQRLRAGESLAHLADSAPGKSARGLIEAIVSYKRERIAAMRQAGQIPAREEQSELATLHARVQAQVERHRRLH